MSQSMPEILVTFAMFAGILSPIVTAVTEVIKRAIPKFPTNLTPLLSVAIGVGLGAMAWIFVDLNTTWRLWGGLFAGLSACGLYDVAKFTSNTFKKPNI